MTAIPHSLKTAALAGMLLICQSCTSQTPGDRPVKFKKHTLTHTYISGGVAVGDINRDGKTDIIAGAYWFEAPGWKPHEIAKPDTFSVDNGYSNSFLNFCMDVNQDGWVDLIRVDFPGKAAVWHENPGNRKTGYWKVHPVYPAVGNESPALVDVDGDGRQDLLCNDPGKKQMIWVRAPEKGDTLWQPFVIGEGEGTKGTHVFTHGLGLGDMNGDGRKDVIIKDGWWEAPENRQQPHWTFHPADLGGDCSQMYVTDADEDGDPDVISASAHNYGVWWHEQKKDRQGNTSWEHHDIDTSFSQSHGMAFSDINGDGYPDLVTGKRYYAHNGHDPGAHEPAVLYWFEFKPGKQPAWIPHKIDDNSGVGLQVDVQDLNKDKLPDIVIANKKGVFYFEQLNR
ncbi:FG-GAP-like repeat-containing protein [Compostibacter hankyongensis]|uniref:VCBS repeat-containing protein n=1 Tax=Compostibacter hankyongensis TaxID=1007089 RepID=A0ABP8FJK8_9BACT